MKRWLVPLLLLMALVLAAPAPAGALSCVNPMDRLAGMQIVVHGKIMAVPKEHWARVQVDRYYRGEGPAELQVEFRGIGGNGGYEWALTPHTGFEGVMELRVDEKGYHLGPCNLIANYGPDSPEMLKVKGIFGEGTPPRQQPEPAPHQPAGGGLPWMTIVLVTAAAGAGAWWVWQRRGK